MAKPLIVGNWKTYVRSLKEARKLFKDIDRWVPRGNRSDVVVCPPSPLIHPLASAYSGKRVVFGAQNTSFDDGSPTGNVLPSVLKDAGASYVIVGHADRRYPTFGGGDTDEIVSKKIVAALAAGLYPILCVGERLRDHEGAYLGPLEKSILGSLSRIELPALKNMAIAYEPVWAIGAAEAPSPRMVREALIFIRKVLASRFSRGTALSMRIIYGGAVDQGNAVGLMTEGTANGFLVGRASAEAEAFTGIIRALHDAGT